MFEYADASYPGGVRRELRPDEEVFNADTLDSFANMPATQGHPPKLLTSADATRYMVGSTGDRAMRDDDHVKTSVMVAAAPTIKKMDDGDRAVSVGYSCLVDPTPGVDPKYGRYDVVQRKIRGNHLAIAIPEGRAGRMARVRMDAEITDAERAEAAAAQKKFERDSTAGPNLYGGRFDANHYGGGAMDPEKLKETIRVLETSLQEKTAENSNLKQRADAADTARDVERGRATMLETEIAGLKVQIAAGATAVESEVVIREKARADEAERKVARFDEVRETLVRERCALMIQGAMVMGHDFRMDDMTDRDIKVAVIKRLDSTADVGNAVPDGMITGVFGQLVKGYKANARSQARVGMLLQEQTTEQPRVDSKEKNLKDFRDQWKKPLPNDLRHRKET